MKSHAWSGDAVNPQNIPNKPGAEALNVPLVSGPLSMKKAVVGFADDRVVAIFIQNEGRVRVMRIPNQRYSPDVLKAIEEAASHPEKLFGSEEK